MLTNMSSGHTLRFLATNATYAHDDEEQLLRSGTQAVECSDDERVADVVRRAEIDTSGSAVWRRFMAREADLSLWFVPAGYAELLGPWDPGTCLVTEDLSIGGLVDYFGDIAAADDCPFVIYPAEPIGGHSGPEWVVLTTVVQEVYESLGPVGLVRAALEAYGAAEAIRSARHQWSRLRCRSARHEAGRWLHEGVASRRLIRFLRRRRRWDTTRLAGLLDLDHRETGVLLRMCGFALARDDFRTWVRSDR